MGQRQGQPAEGGLCLHSCIRSLDLINSADLPDEEKKAIQDRLALHGIKVLGRAVDLGLKTLSRPPLIHIGLWTAIQAIKSSRQDYGFAAACVSALRGCGEPA